MPILQEELITYYRWLRQYGLNDSHSGNASVRDGDNCWITPTGACADTLTSRQLIQSPLNYPPVQGASQDTALHLAVYNINPEAHAILHCHNPHTVAITMNGKDFEPIDLEGQYYFQKIPVLNIPYTEYAARAPQAVAAVLATQPLVVVRGHGVYAQASSLNLAYKWVCSVELSAKTLWLNKQFVIE
ncbi:class II aldolase/adducin family protein [Candidatus Venteria ishoeyi]|uniref:class II aldolase/adducin family protein n=1 Tax=Candidatus Venteria ishoeyi TaxID=1899563 RepID=UPI0025A5CD1B|nr:class II aldolase/adducin family protein [Candidatus Venteria ishoeyi]MDM8547172.1 class II aldolase/adducin family protein [Candidatus Venteria ishoeyi]